ncbi:TRAP transporter large permease [Polaromonas sp.]|uniref:TRAP transporter large permease n=1 Tax=Polaromonas sp. TaxID=1869339 RepID=UPI003BADA597
MTQTALVVSGLLILLLGSGVWIGLGLMATGGIGLLIFKSTPVAALLGQLSWNSATVAELSSLPLFVLMAEILFRTRIAASIFDALAPWTTWLPGRLAHVNVAASTIFAAVSGSSAATAATIGRITLPELARRGYSQSLTMGSLAGAGTLGFLIPPSIVMIVYSVLAQVSLLDMFMAGIIPGLVLAILLSLTIVIMTLIKPELLPKEKETFTWAHRFSALKKLAPVVILVGTIIGSMMTGIATPSEAAAVGVIGAILIAMAMRDITFAGFRQALMGTVFTSSMIGLIVIGAGFLSTSMGYLGVPRAVAEAIAPLNLGPVGLIMLLLLVYLVLGCFLDGISTIVMTLPMVLPLVVGAGYDPIWFGIFLIVTVEMAQITPPVGFNLFVIQGLTNTSTMQVAKAAFPFFLAMLVFAGLIVAAPGIVMWLPRLGN